MASSNGADEAALERSHRVLQPVDAAAAESILKEAKQILDQHRVVFFLRQGTCLGAIRDNGFITWDDDLDLGSVIGLHGFTEKSIDPVVTAFRDNGHFVKVDYYDHYVAVTTMKASIRTDWACYRILDDSIFHFPGIRIPVRLLTHLKEIDFVGEKFLVPNPPEDYLRYKYGPDWGTPKQAGYEKDVLDNMPKGTVPGRAGKLSQFLAVHFFPSRTAKLLVLDQNDHPVPNACVLIAGLNRSRTNRQGYAKFYLPGSDTYAVAITVGEHEEVLYEEAMAPGKQYVYRPDADKSAGRYFVLTEA